MYKHETCRLDYYHGGAGIGFTTNNPDHIEVEYGTSTTRVSGSASGTASVTIRAHNANYTKYIMNVTILPDPVQEYDCSFPLNLECQTKWYDNEGEYAITTTDPAIVDVQLERYYQDPEDTTSQILERTKIIGRTQGTTDVYIYKNGDHKATVHVTVDPPVPTIQVEDGSVTVKQGESVTIAILNGGGNYQEDTNFETNCDDTNIACNSADVIYFDVDTNPDNTGDYTVRGKEPGHHYPTFTDQYEQQKTISVHVTDTTLDLTHETLHLPGSNSEYITATNYYQDVTYTKSNNNIRINKQVMNHDQIAFLITPLIKGETEITFTDNETETIDGEQVHVNTKTVVVTVGDGNNNGQPVSPTTGIRYIRDYLNGSTRNGGHHWVEIQAIEKDTGENQAGGKQVLGRNNFESTTRPLSWITDNNIDTGRYAELPWDQHAWVQVDLGAIYDIDTVKVWHYYADGRTYNDTKTEVSTDGETWYTLFDSAVEGTYAETSEGRSYVIDTDLIQSQIDLDQILQEAGLDNLQISTVDYSQMELTEKERKIFNRINIFVDKYKYRPEILQKILNIIQEYISKLELQGGNESLLATLTLFEQDILLQQASKGVIDATRQFFQESLDIITDVQSYIDLVGDVTRFAGEGIKPLPLRDVEKEEELLLEVVNPEEVLAGLNELWEIVANIDEIVEGLSEYEKTYYETYIYLQGWVGFPFLVKKKRNGGNIMESSETLKKVSKLNLRKKFKTGNFATGKLDFKYDKHVNQRNEWNPKITKDQYLSKARNLLSSKPNSNIVEHIDKDGFMFKYNKTTNEFALGEPNGVIVTIYKPTNGYEYMKEQIIKYP